MARQFGPYSPAVPLGVTWEESIVLEDEDGIAIDLTDFKAQIQFYVDEAERNPDDGLPVVEPLFELTTAAFYSTLPAWDVVAAVSIPTPADGTINITLSVADLWLASPTNEKVKLRWCISLKKVSGYAIPVVRGKPTFLPAGNL